MPLIDQACSLTGRSYTAGDYDDRTSFSMRVLAEHARSSTMLVNDGVFPSNEGRGYVLRRIIRRAVRHAYLLGTEHLVMPSLVETAIDVMGNAYPDVSKNRDFIVGVLTREEERFRQTLKTGLTILEDELVAHPTTLPGSTAFMLHDTYGFPLELTEEIAGERGVGVDGDGFETEMREQRRRAKAARKGAAVDDDRLDSYREIVEQFGITEFLGYTDSSTESRVLAVLPGVEHGTVEIFLDRTPFYAESGGQVGDAGTISADTGVAEVLDTTFALPGLRRHVARVLTGDIAAGATATAAIDVERRDATRRNHTGTHLLHHALRQVLGEHVKQAGSLVGPDRLRFDFSHYDARHRRRHRPDRSDRQPRDADQRAGASLRDHQGRGDGDGRDGVLRRQVRRRRPRARGGQLDRAVRRHPRARHRRHRHHQDRQRELDRLEPASHRGGHRRELAPPAATRRDGARRCGPSGGHVHRRSGAGSAAPSRRDQVVARRGEGACAGSWPPAAPVSSPTAAVDGVVVTRIDGLSPNDLRELAVAVRQQAGVEIVVLGGVSDTGGVSLVAAVTPASGRVAGDLIKDAAKAVGGGGGGKGDIATAGGKNPDGLDEALRIARASLRRVDARPRRRPRLEADRHRRQRPVGHHRLAAHRRGTERQPAHRSRTHRRPRRRGGGRSSWWSACR